MTGLAPPAANSAAICKLLRWNGPTSLPDCVRAGAESATICKRLQWRRTAGRRRAGSSASGLQAKHACSHAHPIVVVNFSGVAPRAGVHSSLRLFRSLRALRMLHCTDLPARIFPNDCNLLDPFPAATCRIAVGRHACIFAVTYQRRGSFAAPQHGAPLSHRVGRERGVPIHTGENDGYNFNCQGARRPVAGAAGTMARWRAAGDAGGSRQGDYEAGNPLTIADAPRRRSSTIRTAAGGRLCPSPPGRGSAPRARPCSRIIPHGARPVTPRRRLRRPRRLPDGRESARR
jgi:hypothetical protein